MRVFSECCVHLPVSRCLVVLKLELKAVLHSLRVPFLILSSFPLLLFFLFLLLNCMISGRAIDRYGGLFDVTSAVRNHEIDPFTVRVLPSRQVDFTMTVLQGDLLMGIVILEQRLSNPGALPLNKRLGTSLNMTHGTVSDPPESSARASCRKLTGVVFLLVRRV